MRRAIIIITIALLPHIPNSMERNPLNKHKLISPDKFRISMVRLGFARSKADLFKDAIEAIKKSEGYESHIYLYRGRYYIGYGRLLPVPNDTNLIYEKGWGYITEKDASLVLEYDISNLVSLVTTKYKLTWYPKVLAIAMFIYGVGIGTYERSKLKTLVDSDKPIDKEILKYCKVRNKFGIPVKNKRLKERREFELNLYNSY
jgi:GH24 family phage-related lysozyme (muramidase)